MALTLRSAPVLPVSTTWNGGMKRWVVSVVGIVLLALLFITGSKLLLDPVRFPVTNVDVTGTLDYTDREQLSGLVSNETIKGFYGMDVEAIRVAVEAMSWVEKAHIRRMWPSRLLLEIEEHEPAARYNEDMLVSKSMELFRPEQLQKDNPRFAEWQASFSNLPRLSGFEGRYEAVLNDYRLYESQLVKYGVSIIELEEDERQSQTLRLSNRITVRLGYEAHELRLLRFLDVFDRLVTPLAGGPAKFDMRYSNGFAFSGATEFRRNN